MKPAEKVVIDGESLDIAAVVAVARHGARVELSPRACGAMWASRAVVEAYVHGGASDEARAALAGVGDAALRARVEAAVAPLEAGGRVAYGVTTGFGSLASVKISVADAERLQYNLIRSHSVGTGRPLPRDAARATMLIRANTLATGISGVRPAVVEQLLAFLNAGLTPVIPSQGSVGASGDLAPSAHMALALIGEGQVDVVADPASGAVARVSARQAMEQAGIAPLRLLSKEGLSIINGTQVMTAIGALALWDAELTFKSGVVAAAMSTEALRGFAEPLDPRIHASRRHPGQIRAADAMRRCVAGSGLVGTCPARVQDSYSMRCAPQVIGPAAEAIDAARKTVEIEMNSATDNPLVFAETGDIRSNGNFHGEPVAMAMDFLAIALAEVASVAERRVARMVDRNVSGLPAFLTPQSGLNSGFMMAQYTAAALVSENKVLTHPACVDSIPTSANQEDHVSMGTIAARKCADVSRHASTVVAIELLIAAQGIDLACESGEFQSKPAVGRGTAAAHAVVRSAVPRLEADRVLATDMERVHSLVESGAIVTAVEAAIGSI